MSEPSLPKFPATPEEIKAASEKAMNFWVGALSPMWVPFWAASSFGLGAWAVSQSMSKTLGEGLAGPDLLRKDMTGFGAMTTKWPGIWGAFGAAPESKSESKSEKAHHVPVPVPEMFSGVTVAAMAAAMSNEVGVAPAEEVAVEVNPVVATVEKPKAVKPKVAKVVSDKSESDQAVSVKVEPRPIAKSMSVVKPSEA